MKVNFSQLAGRVLRTINMLEENQVKVPSGMKGLVGELLTVSKLKDLKGIRESDIEYKGGRSRYDIILRQTERLLVKTKFYGDEKSKYGVDDGFLWSDIYIDEVKEGNEVKRKRIDFDSLVLVGIRDGKAEFYVLTDKEFRDNSLNTGWGGKRGGRVIGVVRKATKDKTLNDDTRKFGDKEILRLFKDSRDAWDKLLS